MKIHDFSNGDQLHHYKKALVLLPYKKELDDHLWMKEQQISGATALSAGSCQNCPPGECTRFDGKPCRHPEWMRYSISSGYEL